MIAVEVQALNRPHYCAARVLYDARTSMKHDIPTGGGAVNLSNTVSHNARKDTTMPDPKTPEQMIKRARELEKRALLLESSRNASDRSAAEHLRQSAKYWRDQADQMEKKEEES